MIWLCGGLADPHYVIRGLHSDPPPKTPSIFSASQVSGHFMELQEFSPSLEPAEWDYYRATIKENHFTDDFCKLLVDAFGSAKPEETKGFYGYDEGLSLLVSGDRALTVYKGGNAGTVCLEASSVYSSKLRAVLLLSGVPFRPSRADACLDYDEEGLSQALFDFGLWFAVKHDLKIEQRGDWERGHERTLYIGSRSSPVFLRIYEKGHKSISDGDDTASPNWVRVEVECKPDRKRREAFSQLEASDLFRAGWVSDFMGALFVQNIARVPIGYQRSITTDARQKRWLAKAGRKIMLGWMDEFSSPEEWGRNMYNLLTDAAENVED